jgi:hypothetical protein
MKLFSLVSLYNQHKFEKALDKNLRGESGAAVEQTKQEEESIYL